MNRRQFEVVVEKQLMGATKQLIRELQILTIVAGPKLRITQAKKLAALLRNARGIHKRATELLLKERIPVD